MIEVKCGNYVSVLEKMEENSVDLMWTCPSPFRHYEDHGDWIGGEGSIHDYIKNLVDLCVSCSRVIKTTGSFFIQLGDKFDKNGHLYGIPAIFEHYMRGMGFALHDRLIWHRTETQKIKENNDFGFRKNYEFIYHFVHRDFFFNIRSKYKNTSIFSYPLEDTYFTNEFDSGLPSELMKIAIDTSCPEGGTVLDPLAGSFKTGIIAKKMGRNFIGIDIDPKICELGRIRLGI